VVVGALGGIQVRVIGKASCRTSRSRSLNPNWFRRVRNNFYSRYQQGSKPERQTIPRVSGIYSLIIIPVSRLQQEGFTHGAPERYHEGLAQVVGRLSLSQHNRKKRLSGVYHLKHLFIYPAPYISTPLEL
jgi:hypothetical protein